MDSGGSAAAGRPWKVAALAGLGGLAAVTLAMPLAAGASPREADPPAAVALAAGPASSALFAVNGLVPGHPVVNCVAVRFRGIAPGGTIRFYAVVRSGELAPYLTMTVRTGSGTGRGCAGFVPVGTAFDGPLPGLAAAQRRSPAGLPVPWLPDPNGEVTFQVTVAVADTNHAQGRATRFDLVWSAPPPATRPATDSGAPGARGLVVSGSVLHRLAQEIARLARTVGLPLLKAGSVGFLMALLVVVFLLLQGRIDRRDPKLALAPIRPPAQVNFTDRAEFP
jgi:hypothetical protein